MSASCSGLTVSTNLLASPEGTRARVSSEGSGASAVLDPVQGDAAEDVVEDSSRAPQPASEAVSSPVATTASKGVRILMTVLRG